MLKSNSSSCFLNGGITVKRFDNKNKWKCHNDVASSIASDWWIQFIPALFPVPSNPFWQWQHSGSTRDGITEAQAAALSGCRGVDGPDHMTRGQLQQPFVSHNVTTIPLTLTIKLLHTDLFKSHLGKGSLHFFQCALALNCYKKIMLGPISNWHNFIVWLLFFANNLHIYK